MSTVAPRSRSQLTPDLIIEAAKNIALRDGFGALSMRNLATELHCSTMAPYRHFEGGHDAIVDEVIARLLPISGHQIGQPLRAYFSVAMELAETLHLPGLAVALLEPQREAMIDRLAAALTSHLLIPLNPVSEERFVGLATVYALIGLATRGKFDPALAEKTVSRLVPLGVA
jgi:AcrR family transcriptional regulator